MAKKRFFVDLNKSIDSNASFYFDKSKKFKKKLEGAQKALDKNLEKLTKLEEKEIRISSFVSDEVVVKQTKFEWYEKFRWFFSSEGFLCVGGRDATSNDIVVKKHCNPEELVFHTEAPGSPFFVIKGSDVKPPGKETLSEVSSATCSFSRGWKQGLGSSEVYFVNASQLSKSAPSGEFIGRGSFSVKGKRNYVFGDMKLALGILKDGRLMCGSVSAVSSNCKNVVCIRQGRLKPSELAKKISRILKYKDLDDIIRKLPSGTSELEK